MSKLWQKWLSGDGRRDDEAALANAAQDDPFVADAMAGYEAMPESDHLAAHERLRRRLAARDHDGLAVLPRARYYQVAAAVAMLLLAGGAFWYANRPSDTVAVVMDSPKTPAEAIAPPAESVEQETMPSPDPIPEQRPRPRRDADGPVVLPAQPLPPSMPARGLGEATAPAVPSSAEDYAEADLLVVEDAAARGAAPSQAEALKEAKEEAVSAPVKTRTSPPAAKMAPRRMLTPPAPSETSSLPVFSALPQGGTAPAGGAEALAQYFATQLRKPLAVQRGEISGTVQVSFIVSPGGRLSDFLVTKPLCTPCDAEAIRLLEEGPAWEVSGADAVKVTCEVVFE